MIAILTFLLIITFSLVITRVASVALTYTGMALEAARFQARSAFTGVGFTSRESEMVVGHPVRRRIIYWLMLMGNAGLVTAIASLMLTFVRDEDPLDLVFKAGLLLAGVAGLFFAARSRWVDHRLHEAIIWGLKRYTKLDVQDYASLLHLSGDYHITEYHVGPEEWIAGHPLKELGLTEEGVIVLAITREDGSFIGAPFGETCIEAGDALVVYGRGSSFADLVQRREGWYGDRRHRKAVKQQEELERRELAQDPATPPPPEEKP